MEGSGMFLLGVLRTIVESRFLGGTVYTPPYNTVYISCTDLHTHVPGRLLLGQRNIEFCSLLLVGGQVHSECGWTEICV